MTLTSGLALASAFSGINQHPIVVGFGQKCNYTAVLSDSLPKGRRIKATPTSHQTWKLVFLAWILEVAIHKGA
jgi:hypothetical protein